jgi:transcriptional regulator with XRE-family HTH domain
VIENLSPGLNEINMRSNDIFTITSAQLRAARALLRWSAEDLANRAKLGVATVRRAEAGEGLISVTPANAATLRATLEGAGVEFIPENGGGAGVRLATHQASKN